MSFHYYSIFLTVVEQNSFVRTAEILNLTPSAISHAMANLEKEFGFPLFIRHRNGLKLTLNGEQLLPYIRELQRGEAALLQEVGQINGLHKGVVRLGVINSVMVTWLPEIVRGFRSLFPKIKIRILQGGYADLIKNTEANIIDLAFTSETAVKTYSEKLTFIPLYRDRLMCVVPKNFRPFAYDHITVDEILKMNVVMQCAGNDADTLELLEKHNVKARSTYAVAEDSSMIALVECGFGISIMPELVIMGTRISEAKTYPLQPCEYRLLGLVTDNPKYYTPATKKFVEYIQAFINENTRFSHMVDQHE